MLEREGFMTDKQEIAVQNYCTKGITECLPGYSWAQAMRDAGYKEGYIDKNSHYIRGKKEVHRAIEQKKAELAQKADIKAERILRETAIIAFSNISDYLQVDEDGEVFLRGFEGIDKRLLAAIESIKVNTTTNKDDSRTYTTTQFKLCSKLTALDQLNKHLGLYKEDNDQRQIDIRIFNLTQLTALIEADKAKVKEIDGITGGIAE